MSAVTFHKGRPLAPINSPQLERDVLTRVTAYCVEHGGDPPDECSFRLGIRHGWLAGWYAGFEAASADTRRDGEDATKIAAEFTSGAVPEGQTPNPPRHLNQGSVSK